VTVSNCALKNVCHSGAKNSFAAEYGCLTCPKDGPRYILGGNLLALDEIFGRFENVYGYEKPDADALLVHLRLGDKIENADATVYTMLTKGSDPFGNPAFKGGIKSIYEYLDNVRQANSSSIIIIGGSQLPDMYRKSRVYADCLKQALESTGKDVTMTLDGGDADRDFYYMSHARKLVVSTGGFSRFIGALVLRHGGEVIGRWFPSDKLDPFYGLNSTERIVWPGACARP
jgi:hypothetical protein